MELAEKKHILNEYTLMMNRYKELNRKMLPSGISYELPRIENGSGYSPLTRIIDEKTEIEKKLGYIEKAVMRIENTEKRYLLEYHYIEGKSLSEIEKNNLLHYSRGHLGKLRDSAVEELELSEYYNI